MPQKAAMISLEGNIWEGWVSVDNSEGRKFSYVNYLQDLRVYEVVKDQYFTSNLKAEVNNHLKVGLNCFT